LGTSRLELLATLVGVGCTRTAPIPCEKEIPLNRQSMCSSNWIAGKEPLAVFVQNRDKEITEAKDISSVLLLLVKVLQF